LCFSNGLSSVFKNRFWLRKNPLLKLFFTLEALFGAIFSSVLAYFSHISVHVSFLGALWERWGPTFSSQKRFGPPKAPQWDFPQNKLTFLEQFWGQFL
jgi:hypothetical protein